MPLRKRMMISRLHTPIRFISLAAASLLFLVSGSAFASSADPLVFASESLVREGNLSVEWTVVDSDIPGFPRLLKCPFTVRDFSFASLEKKISIDVEETSMRESLVLFLGQIDDADRVYFNGTLIGETQGSWEPGSYSSRYFETRIYRIPSESVIWDGINVIRIEIVNYTGSGGWNGSPRLTLMKESYFTRTWVDGVLKRPESIDLVYLLLIGAFTAFGLISLLNFAYYRKDLADLFLALMLFALSAFVYTGLSGDSRNRIPYEILNRINPSSIEASLLLVPFFIASFLGAAKKTGWKVIIGILGVANALVIASEWLLPFPLVEPVFAWYLRTLPAQAVIYIVLSLYATRRGPETSAVIVGLAVWFALGVYDILDYLAVFSFDWFVENASVYGYFAFILTITAFKSHDILSMRHKLRKANLSLEELNRTLEARVEERTQDLVVAHEKLEKAFEELSGVNAMAERDMKMAIAVQENVFHSTIPESPDWEIAAHLKPMSGVSGDFWDYYTDQRGSLSGLGIYDVSGHGIASGLITMIAKSALRRSFRVSSDIPLGAVVDSANAEISRDKGDAENYLTGVVLRFDGDKVEYVNAGHDDIIFRNSETGKAAPVNVKGKDFRGMFMGIEALRAPYASLKFSMKPGDALLLYTDALTESRNPKGVSYEKERIVDSFERARTGGAEAILTKILDDFHSFTETRDLKDDLTVIVIRRKG